MPADAVTGLCGLELLGLKPDDDVVIFGASGGIGHLAVQLAKRMGARVFAVASGNDGVALVRTLGADAAVDGHGGDVGKAAIDPSQKTIQSLYDQAQTTRRNAMIQR